MIQLRSERAIPAAEERCGPPSSKPCCPPPRHQRKEPGQDLNGASCRVPRRLRTRLAEMVVVPPHVVWRRLVARTLVDTEPSTDQTSIPLSWIDLHSP